MAKVINNLFMAPHACGLHIEDNPGFCLLLVDTTGNVTVREAWGKEIIPSGVLVKTAIKRFIVTDKVTGPTVIVIETTDGSQIPLGEVSDELSAYTWVNRVNLHFRRTW